MAIFAKHWTHVIASCLLFAFAFSGNAGSNHLGKLVHETAVVPAAAASNDPPIFETRTVMRYQSGFAHSPTLIEHADGSFQAIWYHGEGEGDHTMGLDSARFVNGNWRYEGTLLSAVSETLERGYFIKTIGNPVLMKGPGQSIWLFYVTPSLGGWATARVSMRQSDDNGRTFANPKTLVTEPLFNMSTHVRFPGGRLTGGGYYLPAYHEMLVKFPEVLLLDNEGSVVGRRRVGGFGSQGIQGSIAMQNPMDGNMFIRSVSKMPGYVHVSQTGDGGETWSVPAPSTLESSGSPACSLALPNGDVVLGYNPGRSRAVLKFALHNPKDGTFRDLDHVVKNQQGKGSNTYCFGYAASDGFLHFVFSRFGLKSIEHVRFNQSWIYKDQ